VIIRCGEGKTKSKKGFGERKPASGAALEVHLQQSTAMMQRTAVDMIERADLYGCDMRWMEVIALRSYSGIVDDEENVVRSQ
jgi:hypothetical protein